MSTVEENSEKYQCADKYLDVEIQENPEISEHHCSIVPRDNPVIVDNGIVSNNDVINPHQNQRKSVSFCCCCC